MAGEYRTAEVLNQLPPALAEPVRTGQYRVALTSQPMSGVIKLPDMNETYAQAYEDIGLSKYAQGLRNGSMIVIAPYRGPEKVWKSGELFLKS